MSPSVEVTIRSAGRDDIPAVADVLAASLGTTTIARWLVPDQGRRRRVHRDYFRVLAGWFVEFGCVDIANGGAGAALWATCRRGFDPDIADYDTRLAEACGSDTPRFLTLDKVMAEHHPTIRHEYLALLGVDPDEQGRGIGSALLAHQHANLDDARLPAYLEATSLRNAALYKRHGYTHYDHAFPVAAGGPLLYPMWRLPRHD